ncbi:MAG: oxidoreductase [Mycobacteriales bacterium]|nr:MAG: oxidoreductase [Pseudonocardiales bacterium]
MPVVDDDVLAPLMRLPAVTDSAAAARRAVDRLLRHRILRRCSADVSLETALRGAQASAALSGCELDLDQIRSGRATDPVAIGAVRVAGAVGELATTFRRAPMQALARLHVLAARDLAPPDRLGRPVIVGGAARRLGALPGLVTVPTSVPAVVVAAVVHGELLTLRPFAVGNGVVARAAARLTMVGRGLDPKALTVPELGHLVRREEYLAAASAYASGDPDGVAAWIVHCCVALQRGAQEGLAICESLARGAA